MAKISPDRSKSGSSDMLLKSPTCASPTVPQEEAVADVDEPPDLEATPRPSNIHLNYLHKANFAKSTPQLPRKASLLTSALTSAANSPIEEKPSADFERAMATHAWSNNSTSPAELTSDGGFTSAVSRASTPSPPPPRVSFKLMMPMFNKKPSERSVSVVRSGDESVDPLQKAPSVASQGEEDVEVTLGRKRCITFACGNNAVKSGAAATSAKSSMPQPAEAPRRATTIKFACPSKISTGAPSQNHKVQRTVSPAPVSRTLHGSPRPISKLHRDSDSTDRTLSPASVRKQPIVNRGRRLSLNPDLARTEAYRFHEFASSEDEADEWTQESTCHRSRLTVTDTLRLENNLRQLGEEAEEEALHEDEEDLVDDEDEDDNDADGDDGDANSDFQDGSSDEGFQTDDEEGFATSDDDSDAGSDFNWWTPNPYSTATTSLEGREPIRPRACSTNSESSVGSLGSAARFQMPRKPIHKRKKSRPVKIGGPTPELPDSTDFVCGTLDEDRPLEAAYMNCLERRRAAKHIATPQDIDPTFPTSDPEIEPDDDDEEEVTNIDVHASESDQHLMMHGRMDPIDGDLRGRRRSVLSLHSPAISPRPHRSPQPKRAMHLSPPPRNLLVHSPRQARSPAPTRLRSPPPTRRGSHVLASKRHGLSLHFADLPVRPTLTVSTSLPRTPLSVVPPEYENDEENDTCVELPTIRRAIDIKVGLEKKRQRRKEQLYKKLQRKGVKEKRPAPGKGAERMREMGVCLAAKGKQTGFGFAVPPISDQQRMHVLSV